MNLSQKEELILLKLINNAICDLENKSMAYIDFGIEDLKEVKEKLLKDINELND